MAALMSSLAPGSSFVLAIAIGRTSTEAEGPTAGVPRQSSALWSLPKTGGASRNSLRHVQCHGGANECLQRLFVNLVALMKVDGAPHIAFEAGVEKA
jgi:hypothetical protein